MNRTKVKLKKKRDGSVTFARRGHEKKVAALLVNALAFHLHETLSDEVSNEEIAEAIYGDILEALDRLRAEK